MSLPCAKSYHVCEPCNLQENAVRMLIQKWRNRAELFKDELQFRWAHIEAECADELEKVYFANTSQGCASQRIDGAAAT